MCHEQLSLLEAPTELARSGARVPQLKLDTA